MTRQTLKEAIRQTKPFTSLESEAFLTLIRAADELAYEVGQAMKLERISQPQYNALRILRGSLPDGLPCSEVAARMVTRVPDVTRLLDRLERSGLVTRARQEGDRRVVLARITRRGLDLLARLDAPLAEVHGRLFTGLSRAELRELIRLLEAARP